MKVIEGQNDKTAGKSSVTAFEELVEPHQTRIYSYLLRACGNELEASRLTQDIFVKAYEMMLSGGDTGSVQVFIYRAAAETCRQTACRSEMIS